MQQFQLRRINSFQGLMIDADVWRDAHDYHRDHMRLHQLALHGWGIVHGLDVTVERSDNTLLISPGLGIDPAGNVIVVSQPQAFRIESRSVGTVYLTLQFREVLTGPTQSGLDEVGPPIHIVEAYQIQERQQLPNEPHLELARVQLEPSLGSIVAPADPDNPGPNELDLRHRARVGTSAAPTTPLQTPLAPAIQDGGRGTAASPARIITQAGAALPGVVEIGIGAHGGGGWDRHREGLRFLAREVEATTAVPVRMVDPLQLSDADRVDLLYLSGHGRLTLKQDEVTAISRLLDRGGVVFGEGCASSSGGEAAAREFALSVAELAEQLGRRLAEVGRGHPLLLTRHVFAEAPAGSRDRARLVVAGGMVYSDSDYGCAWQGGPSERPLPRSAIRDALEFGVNAALYRPSGQ